MAMISISGTVTGGKGGDAVTIKTFENGKIATFSVADRQYFYSKDADKKGQFYSCTVSGKAAEIVADRLRKGDKVAVTGQLVQREYNDKLYLDVKNCQVTFLESRPAEAAEEDAPF